MGGEILVFRSVWDFSPQVMPIALALVVVYFPTVVRRRSQSQYTPLYFSAYPLASLNQNLYDLYVRDLYIQTGQSTDGLPKVTKERIRRQAYASSALDALIIPLSAGVACATFMTEKVFRDFLVIFCAIKVLELGRSTYHFAQEQFGSRGVGYVLLTYVTYFVVAVSSLHVGYSWLRPFVEDRDLAGLVDASSSSLVTLLIGVVTLPLAIHLMGGRLAERAHE